MSSGTLANADRKGIVTAIMAPDRPHSDGTVYFTFEIERSFPEPKAREVLYLDLAQAHAAATQAVVGAAFASGHGVEIGLNGCPGDAWRTVAWVQAVRRI